MAQYTITATSAKANSTVTNTNTKSFPSPAEFVDQATADAQAAKYAEDLNHDDYQAAWDWVGAAVVVPAAK